VGGPFPFAPPFKPPGGKKNTGMFFCFFSQGWWLGLGPFFGADPSRSLENGPRKKGRKKGAQPFPPNTPTPPPRKLIRAPRQTQGPPGVEKKKPPGETNGLKSVSRGGRSQGPPKQATAHPRKKIGGKNASPNGESEAEPPPRTEPPNLYFYQNHPPIQEPQGGNGGNLLVFGKKKEIRGWFMVIPRFKNRPRKEKN